jgi:hypothetical protein
MCCGVWSNNRGDPVIQQQNQTKMKAVIKMFFVMGLTWIAEFVSWALTDKYGGHAIYKTTFVFDLINALQVFTKTRLKMFPVLTR